MDTIAATSTDTIAALPRCTIADIRDLPVIDFWHVERPSVAALFRISRSASYDAAARGDLPALRIGSRVVCPVPALLAVLGAVENPEHGSGVTVDVTSEAKSAHPALHATANALDAATR